MWHEARKQERLIRGMIVDYRRRAERRKDFYEKIKAEPTQFLQIHGRPCKIHLDPAVAAAVDSPGIMMPWQGDSCTLIDRFDVRAHLDYIPEVKVPETPPSKLSQEERQCNYERYRILAQNNFLSIGEMKFLQQLSTDEKFGVTTEEREAAKEKSLEKKGTGAAIGYNYNDPGTQPSCSTGLNNKTEDDSDDESDLDIIDVDLCIDVNKMESSQAHELNALGPKYGMAGCDLFSFLTADADDVDHQKQLLREEKEKAMYSGRKSRRERRAHRDKRLSTRVGTSPPSYAAPSEKSLLVPSRSPSKSRSPSPKGAEKIEFITSFGGDEDDSKPSGSKTLFADKVKINLKKRPTLYSEIARGIAKRSKISPANLSSSVNRPFGPHRPKSRSRSRSRQHRKSPSHRRSRSKSRSRSRSYSRSRSRYRSYSRSRSRSSSRSYRGKSRSPISSYDRRNRSRSYSYSSDDRNEPSRAPVPRYYGRRKEDKESSSGLSDSEASGDDNKDMTTGGSKSVTYQSQIRSGSSNKVRTITGDVVIEGKTQEENADSTFKATANRPAHGG